MAFGIDDLINAGINAVGAFLGFLALLPVWAQSFVISTIFFADVEYKFLQGIINFGLGFFGMSVISGDLAIIFFCIGCMMLLLSVKTLDK